MASNSHRIRNELHGLRLAIDVYGRVIKSGDPAAAEDVRSAMLAALSRLEGMIVPSVCEPTVASGVEAPPSRVAS
ncbi:MAG: hypothetical protein KDA61_07350 [Planctomycetales bacterium]|nr:hypothetical protein [Planctomycetales bacterium]